MASKGLLLTFLGFAMQSASLCVLSAQAANAGDTPAATQEPGAVSGKVAREGHYRILHDKPAQVIWGLGFEIQSDSIGSGNNGLPEEVIGVPHDLVPPERERLYHQMLRGFRYCRLALGLYLRGTDNQGKQIIERYPGQMKDLLELQEQSGIEGFAPEYWSPPPFWKSNGKLDGKGGTLKSFEPVFLNDFAEAAVQDLKYLQDHGLKVVMWGLQNEPHIGHGMYSTCHYTGEEYLQAFQIVAPKIHAAFPHALIHVASGGGQGGDYGKAVRKDPEALKYVGAWTHHKIGDNSNSLIADEKHYRANTEGLPVFNNEFEYSAASDDKFVNTAQSIMNWYVFADAPTWFWLHALKPIKNSEASGYSLGFWRPPGDTSLKTFPDLKPGHWTYNPRNFNALAGFLRHIPWDSQRISVQEDQVRPDNRILAVQTPPGKLVLVVSNRTLAEFSFAVNTGRDATFKGYRYTPQQAHVELEPLRGPIIAPRLIGQSYEVWVEQ